MSKTTNPALYWTPRLLGILFVILLALFSLDVITPEASSGEILLGLLMHNIPTLVVLLVVIVAWKYEIAGAIAFILGGLAYMGMVFNSEAPWYLYLSWSATIAGPALLTGILFYASWRQKHLS